MLYVLICEDKPDSEALRKSVRDRHLEHLNAHDVRYAGPMLAEDEATMIGSVIVVEAENRAAADAFAAADPYRDAGLFDRVTIRPFKQVICAG
jgi:uncharacterized protein YciI